MKRFNPNGKELTNNEFFSIGAMGCMFVMSHGMNAFEDTPEYKGFIMNEHIPDYTEIEYITQALHQALTSVTKDSTNDK